MGLRAFTSHCDEAAAATVVTSGGLDAVIVALMSAPDNVELQERGLATLAMLTSRESGISPEARSSSLEVVVSAMRLHVASLEVQRWGIGLLAALGDGRNKSEALDRSIVSTTVGAMRTNLQELGLQISAQDVLWTMTHNEADDVVRLVLEEGGPQAVIEAGRAHPESRELAQACNTWRRVIETMAWEHGVSEATALAYPAQDPPQPQDAPGDVAEEAEGATTASDSDEEREIRPLNG